MGNAYEDLFSDTTPQREPILGRETDMTRNPAGGFTFKVDKWTQLDRFLILGAEGGTYYTDARKHARDNVECLNRCLDEDGLRVVQRVVELVKAGRAFKPDPLILAWALALKKGKRAFVRRAAAEAASTVLKTGTHLFQAAALVDKLGGWGALTRQAFSSWYRKAPRDLAYQVTKYQQRGGWSHRDVLRLGHPSGPAATEWRAVLDYACGRSPGLSEEIHGPIIGAEAAQKASSAKEIVQLIDSHDLVREVIPTQWLNEPAVWEALLQKMPGWATIRNLAKMTAIGLLKPLGKTNKVAVQRIRRAAKESGVHPMAFLIALKAYQRGQGLRGSLTWTPVPVIVDALDGAFRESFKAYEPTGKNHLLAIDVSASMGFPESMTLDGLMTSYEAAGAMAMITARAEPNTHIVAFSTTVQEIGITAQDTVESATRKLQACYMGGTDCAAAIRYAREHAIDVDTFVVYSDQETWAGYRHPSEELKLFRKKQKPGARLVTVDFVAHNRTVGDPKDAGTLAVVGFDAQAPAMIADFSRGEV